MRASQESIAVLRARARGLFGVALARADPARAVDTHFARNPFPTLPGGGRLFMVAFGKAAPAMMQAARAYVPRPCRALCITHEENLRGENAPLSDTLLLAGGHPVPDERSARAGQAVKTLLRQARASDHVLALVSGGGSALMVAPCRDVSLADKMALNRLLLASGMAIETINLVRQSLSELKGGEFLRLAAPARVSSLILSDVIGDDLRAIASGPTAPPIGTEEDARQCLREAGLWNALPQSVRAHLMRPASPLPPLPRPDNALVGSNRDSCAAMLEALRGSGLAARLAREPLRGDVAAAADVVLEAVEEMARSGPSTRPFVCLFGGETTVRLQGSGKGGRNQELALRVASGARERFGASGALLWAFLSAGTDGRDGPTEAAGGIVDSGTVARIVSKGGNIPAMLANNDSHRALSLSGDLLLTGATGTNVADIQIFVGLPLSS